MSRGRRGDKTFTGPNSAATDRLRELDKLRSTPAGTHERVAAHSPEAIRAFIAAQRCPWCDAGPFKVLATHTRSAHGVDGGELREMAGLGRFASICAEDHAASQAARLAGQRLPDSAYGEAQRKPRKLTAAGRASQREKAARVSQADRLRAARISGDKQLEANAAKHEEIVRRFRSGEAMGFIADAVGVSAPTVRRTLKRAGLYLDGRTRRWRA